MIPFARLVAAEKLLQKYRLFITLQLSSEVEKLKKK